MSLTNTATVARSDASSVGPNREGRVSFKVFFKMHLSSVTVLCTPASKTGLDKPGRSKYSLFNTDKAAHFAVLYL